MCLCVCPDFIFETGFVYVALAVLELYPGSPESKTGVPQGVAPAKDQRTPTLLGGT